MASAGKRRFVRVRRWCGRAAVAAALILSLACAASFRFGIFRGLWRSGEYSTLALEQGAVTYQRTGPSLMMHGGEPVVRTFNAWSVRLTLRDDPMGLRRWAPWVPLWTGRSGHQRSCVSFPLWIPAAAFGAAAWWLAGPRRRSGCCPACGYPRQGLATAVPCPECGELLA